MENLVRATIFTDLGGQTAVTYATKDGRGYSVASLDEKTNGTWEVFTVDPATNRSMTYRNRTREQAEAIALRHIERNGYEMGETEDIRPAEDLTREEIAALPLGQVIVDEVGMEWEQTAPGRWWDKTYPEDTGFKLPERGDLYFRYSPFRLKAAEK